MQIDLTNETLMPVQTRKQFIFGGKAIFTLAFDNIHYTYSVKKADNAELYFVGVLTGSDNYSDYRYAGLIRDLDTPIIQSSAKSKISLTAPSMVVLQHFLSTFDENIEMFHVGQCGICGKRLTDPVSVSLGIGPKCRGDI